MLAANVLAANVLAADVLAAIDDLKADLACDIQDLITIPSVTGSPAESQAQAWVADRMRHLGMEVVTWRTPLAELAERPGFPGVEIDREFVTGVLGRLGPGEVRPEKASPDSGALLLLGHSDVVPASDWPDAFLPSSSDGWITGRGSVDMKSGLAVALHVVRAIGATGARPLRQILVASVSGEEDGGCGTFDLLSRGVRPARCVIPEPTAGQIVVANGGALGFRITLTGRSAHAARRWEGVSALDSLHRINSALASLEAELCADPDPLMADWPIPYPTSIGIVSGGDWASTVMGSLQAQGRFGVPLGMPVTEARARFEAAVRGATSEQGAAAAVEWVGGQFEPARQDPGANIVRRVAEAHRSVTAATAKITGATYGSDLRQTLAAGIPTVLYGPGDPALSHTSAERVWLDEALDVAKTIAIAALTD
ncbi:MAG: M20/M25/M40 family metallo-hydrolase [Candidatus Nanopelagicales bacterium]|nr:M20/M25/M40 family metallo-hydrolase [Candidatus Nanopelagicales bacterium]